jgi:hypothetical protein
MSLTTAVEPVVATPESLDVFAERIRAEHEPVVLKGSELVEHAIAAGRMLIDVKQRVGHGHFGAWLVAHFPASQDTAQRYM